MNRSAALSGMEETIISSSNLNESQEDAIVSCIGLSECQHQSTVKLIWGPPGTGKTKTGGLLLFSLLKLKCRTLTCAPTNIAVLQVTSVGMFPELKHTQFMWFGNLPTPRSYWFVLMKLTNNTTKEEENLLNSTLHSSSLYSSLFSLLSVFSISATSLCSLDTHTRNFTGGHNNIQLMGVRGSPPPCAKWEIR